MSLQGGCPSHDLRRHGNGTCWRQEEAVGVCHCRQVAVGDHRDHSHGDCHESRSQTQRQSHGQVCRNLRIDPSFFQRVQCGPSGPGGPRHTRRHYSHTSDSVYSRSCLLITYAAGNLHAMIRLLSWVAGGLSRLRSITVCGIINSFIKFKHDRFGLPPSCSFWSLISSLAWRLPTVNTSYHLPTDSHFHLPPQAATHLATSRTTSLCAASPYPFHVMVR